MFRHRLSGISFFGRFKKKKRKKREYYSLLARIITARRYIELDSAWAVAANNGETLR